MELFNRKLNMKNIRGLIILLFLVKHGNTDSTPVTASPIVAKTSMISTTAPKTSTAAVQPTSAVTNSSKTPLTSTPLKKSPTTPTLVPTTKVTVPPSPTTITTLPTTKAPDQCYEFSCDNVNCTANEDNLVFVSSTVKKCTRRSTGSCYAKRTIDSTKANITNYALGCSAVKCDGENLNITVTGTVNVTIGCCQGNLCNGVPINNEGQIVNYNLLLSVLCIAMLTMIKG